MTPPPDHRSAVSRFFRMFFGGSSPSPHLQSVDRAAAALDRATQRVERVADKLENKLGKAVKDFQRTSRQKKQVRK